MEILGILAVLLVAWIAFKIFFRLTIRLFTCGLLGLLILAGLALLARQYF